MSERNTWLEVTPISTAAGAFGEYRFIADNEGHGSISETGSFFYPHLRAALTIAVHVLRNFRERAPRDVGSRL